jgi:hypothetical protein
MLISYSAKGASQTAAYFAVPSNQNGTGICKPLPNISPCKH